MIFRAAELTSPDQIRSVVAAQNISFFDFGCSHGANIGYVRKKTGLVGLGFDISEKKLQSADRQGYLVSDLNILDLPETKLVDYGFFSHMLEHLPTLNDVRCFIEKACAVCHKQVLIKQPYVDSDLFLFQTGLKMGYSHWTGHQMNLTTPVLYNMLNDLRKKNRLSDFMIYYNLPILDSHHTKVFAIDADIDSVDYNAACDLSKPVVRFNFPHFHQINAILFLDDQDESVGRQISKPDVIMYDSRTGYVNRALFLKAYNRQFSFALMIKRVKIKTRSAAKRIRDFLKGLRRK